MRESVQVREQVKLFLDRLAPESRRRIKLAMRGLATERGDRQALREKLVGYHRLRVGSYRVIYRYLPGSIVECVYAEERSLVYKLFEREMLERLRHEDPPPPAQGEDRVEEAPSKYSAGRKRARKAKTKKRSG